MDHYATPPGNLYYTLRVLDFLLDVIFPRSCIGCEKNGKYFCGNCRKTIRFYSPLISASYRPIPYLDGLFVLAHYDGIVRKAIREVKYRGKYNIFSEVAEMFPKNLNFKFDYLVPVPLSKQRLQERGFNQAEKLAKCLKYAPVLDCLKRTRETKPQFGLKREERFENVKNAFTLKKPIECGDYCLVDDVATTGSTLSECAKVLKKSGANKVYAVCIARGN